MPNHCRIVCRRYQLIGMPDTTNIGLDMINSLLQCAASNRSPKCAVKALWRLRSGAAAIWLKRPHRVCLVISRHSITTKFLTRNDVTGFPNSDHRGYLGLDLVFQTIRLIMDETKFFGRERWAASTKGIVGCDHLHQEFRIRNMQQKVVLKFRH